MSGRTRTPNMKPHEDELLCQSYVKVSTNPIVGNNQPGTTFWSTIEEDYNANPEVVIKRAGGSLQTRFSTISGAVMVYASKIAHAYASSHGSGSNELDWVNRAREDYQTSQSKPFTFDKCYQILKVLPKYDTNTTRVNTYRFSSEGNETSSPGTPTTPIASMNLNDDSPIDIESPSDRPEGRKASKLRQKKKSRTSNVAANVAVVESVEKFSSSYIQNVEDTRQARIRFESQMEELIKLRKDEVELREREMESKLRKEEDLIMTADTTNMSYHQQQYYKMRFEEIMQRRLRQSQISGSSSNPN